jgi:hypothetical protein
MATQSKKWFCVFEIHSTKSVTTLQRSFRSKFNKNPPSANSRRFSLVLRCHFITTLIIAFLADITGVTSQLPRATVFNFPFQCCFISVRRLVLLNKYLKPPLSCVFTLHFKRAYCPLITSWSLRGVNVLSAAWDEYKACRWTEDFLLVSDKKTSWFIA